MNCQLWTFSLNCYDLIWTSYIILNIYLKRFPGGCFFFFKYCLLKECQSFSFVGQNSKSWIYLIQKDSRMNLKISFIHLIFLLVLFFTKWLDFFRKCPEYIYLASSPNYLLHLSKYALSKWSVPSVTETFCSLCLLPIWNTLF